MCGIVGTLSFENSSFRVTEPYLVRMRDTLIHRGPDGAGVWVSENGQVGLGHRRLAIIDLSESASQPMCNKDRSLWIVFNGEIYNHMEIRAELESLGRYCWQTDHSDTEMFLHAFEEWGIDCLKRFRGMFAAGIWNQKSRELWLIRDRIGIKPLYYSLHHGRITFASEIKALLEDPDQKRKVNEEAFFDYLSFLTTPAPSTLFDGIKKLQPGTWLKVNASGTVQEQRYWDVYDATNPLTESTEEEIAERILDELRSSVRYRTVSDVPVGIFLSGGVDSGTNAALFSESNQGPLRTFTIGYEEGCHSNPTEAPIARRMAQRFGAEHEEYTLTQNDLIDFLPKMIQLQDEPIADPVCVPVYYVSKLARENGVKVCQVGEGADELFCGYPGWQRMLNLGQATAHPLGKFLSRVGAMGLQLSGRSHTWQWEKLRRISKGLPVFWGGAEAFTEREKFRLLSPRLRKAFAGRTSWSTLEPIYQRFLEKAWDPSPLNWMSYLDLQFRLPELLLMRVDKMSMGVSLEARVPFLDHEFVTLAMSVPSALKNRDGNLKHIFKKSVRGVIPDEIIDRKKQGFGVPVYEWLYGRLGKVIEAELNDFCDQTDFLDRQEVMQTLKRGGQAPWYLLNFALWWKTYISGNETSSLITDSLPHAA